MIYRFGDNELDTREYSLRRNGEEMRLQPRVYRMLKYFLDHRDRIISKDELHEHVWPNQFISNATMESAIRSVRRAVGDSGREQRIIQTVWGYGYRLITAVTEHETEAPGEAGAAMTPKSSSEGPAFVGRQRELMILQDALAGIERGQGRLVGIAGAPGIGKTRLLRTFRQQLGTGQFTYIEGAGQPHQSTVPYGLISGIVRQICHITEPVDSDTLISEILSVLQALGLGDEGRAAYLCDLLRPRRRHLQLTAHQPEWTRLRTVSAVCDLLLAASRQQPLVLAIDDIHWMDRASEACLLALAEHIAQAEILVVAAYVPAYQPKWPERATIRRQLNPLTKTESLALLREHTKSELPHAAEQAILAKAAGQPLLVHELTQWLMHHTHDSTWELPPGLPGDAQEVLRLRLMQLPDHARQLMLKAAVFGFTFTRQQLGLDLDVLPAGETPIDTEASLHLLEQQGWLEVDIPTGAYTFKHGLARDVAYGSLPVKVRQDWHQTIAQAFESGGLTPCHDTAAAVAYHAVHAAIPLPAIQALVELAERSMRAGYPNDALIDLQDALSWVDKLHPGQQRTARLDLILRQACALFALGQVQVALDLLAQESFEAVRDAELESRYALLISRLHRHQQAWTEVLPHAERAVEAAVRCENGVRTGQACVLLAEARYWAGSFGQGLASSKRAVQLLEPSDNPFQLAMACFLVGLNALGLGAFADARQAIEQMRSAASATDDPHLLPFADWAMGWIQAAYGAWDDAIAACRRSLEHAPDQLSMALATGWLGYAYLEKGEAAEAAGLLEQAAYHTKQLQRQRLEALLTLFLAEALLAADDAANARDLAQQGLSIARAASYRYGAAWGHRTQGRVALAMQSTAMAERHFRHALSSFTAMEAHFEAGRTHLALAHVAPHEGRSAAQHLNAALTAFHQLQVPYYVEYTRQRQRMLNRG